MKSKIAYICPELNIHHSRILDTLQESFTAQIYREEQNQNLSQHDFDIVIYSPLSVDLNRFNFSNSSKLVGISMAYDLNHELYESTNQEKILDNLKLSDLVVVDCEHSKSSLRKLDYNNEIVVAPYGCDQAIWAESITRDFSKKNFLASRSWNKIHNNELLFDAISMSQNLQNYEFSFSYPDLRTELMLKETYMVAMQRIHFHEMMNQIDLKSYSDNFTFYISTSISDGSSVSLLEAMSTGMICIASSFESNIEWIQDGYNGFIFENNNSENLMKVLENVVELDAITLHGISKNAVDSLRPRGDWSYNSKRIMDAMKSVNGVRP